jgi:hypothetical protein
MRILNFDDFLLEFESTKHFQRRSNINKKSEEGKINYEDGSRMLPLDLTRVKSGYSIKRMLGAENFPYEDWLSIAEIDRDVFESFMSQIWNYQASHPVIQDKMFGKPGKFYSILSGPLIIKTGKFDWNPVFSTGGRDESSHQFMYIGEGDSLITLYPVHLKISDEEIRRRIYGHNYREDKNNFRERFPNLESFKLGENLVITKMSPNGIEIDFDPADPQNLEKAKAKIDEAYGLIKTPKKPTLEDLPPETLTAEEAKRWQFGPGEYFVYHGEEGKESINFSVRKIDNLDEIKALQKEKNLPSLKEVVLSGMEWKIIQDGRNFRNFESPRTLRLKKWDEISIYSTGEYNKKVLTRYFIGNLATGEPSILAQGKIQMWLYDMETKKRKLSSLPEY